MTGELFIDRGDYDPLNNPDHRVPPVVGPEVGLPAAPPGREGELAETVAANVPAELRPPAEPVVAGRMDDRPHFLRNVGGVELCGQCGDPFPCQSYLRTVEGVVELTGPATGVVLVDLPTAAAAAGLSESEFRARLEAQGRRYS